MTKSALDEIEDMVCRLCDATRDREAASFSYRRTVDRDYEDARQEVIAAFLRLSSERDEMVEAIEASLGLVEGKGPPNWDWLRSLVKKHRALRAPEVR